mgnify:CR=1 FL=1
MDFVSPPYHFDDQSIIRPDESSVSLTKLVHAMATLILLLESLTQNGAHLSFKVQTVKIKIPSCDMMPDKNYPRQSVLVSLTFFYRLTVAVTGYEDDKLLIQHPPDLTGEEAEVMT